MKIELQYFIDTEALEKQIQQAVNHISIPVTVRVITRDERQQRKQLNLDRRNALLNVAAAIHKVRP